MNVDILAAAAGNWAEVARAEGLTRGELVVALMDQHGDRLAAVPNLRKLAAGSDRERWPLTLTPDEAADLAAFADRLAPALGRRSTSAAVTALLASAGGS